MFGLLLDTTAVTVDGLPNSGLPSSLLANPFYSYPKGPSVLKGVGQQPQEGESFIDQKSVLLVPLPLPQPGM